MHKNSKEILNTDKITAFLSKAPLNIALHVGDDVKNVLENRKKILQEWGVELENLAWLNQVHGNEIKTATKGGFLGDGDGIVLQSSGVMGMVMVADCNPILLHSSNSLVLLHGGRVSLQKGIIYKAVEILRQDCGEKDISCYVGPSIRGCCYEVGEEVVDRELEAGRIQKEGRVHLDLIAVIRVQLQKCGVDKIAVSEVCTHCKGEEYFSYRLDKKCGRFGLFAMLK
ncbi:polyphenol oxidase family protein [Helicobacter burdigaliensis]